VDAETLDLLDNFNYRSISEISFCPHSGKKSLKIPNGQSESIFGLGYFVIFRA
jgi:hypothetical protein